MLIKDQHCLESIIEAIDRIIEYTSGFNSADDFNNDYRNFDATMMNFVVIGEMVEKISDDFKKKHSSIEWIKIKGFRNIVAHDYFGIDAEEVWQIIKDKIPKLKGDIQSLFKL
ncbi:MAG: HepT-like ribonuclease domain-containing protein [Bacteroidales bacterium]